MFLSSAAQQVHNFAEYIRQEKIEAKERKTGRFCWTRERQDIFYDACIALIYLNGGRVELLGERRQKLAATVFSPKPIGILLKRGGFPCFQSITYQMIKSRLNAVRRLKTKPGEVWEETMLNSYRTLEATRITTPEGEEISELRKRLDRFHVQPEEFDRWVLDGEVGELQKEKEAPECVADPQGAEECEKMDIDLEEAWVQSIPRDLMLPSSEGEFDFLCEPSEKFSYDPYGCVGSSLAEKDFDEPLGSLEGIVGNGNL